MLNENKPIEKKEQKIQNKKHKKGLWITLGVIVFLILVGLTSPNTSQNQTNTPVYSDDSKNTTNSTIATNNKTSNNNTVENNTSTNSSSNTATSNKNTSSTSSSVNSSTNSSSEKNTNTSNTATTTPKSSSTTPNTDNQSYTVYITKTGSKYHRAGCRYLKKSSIAIDKNEAISEGYTACSVCNP